uniref:4-hydroxy-2-oxovalerate aldolase n=1 Tax=Nocardia farcinica TaxID=37329 RepID=UPI0024555811
MAYSAELDIRVTDTSLRDGSHHKRHQFTATEVRDIVAALDGAGVPVIEVTHGDGLGGSSFNYGFSKTPEQELVTIAAQTAKQAKIAVLMLPGVGVKEDIKVSQDNGASICRIATHCTEADVSIQHFGLARELGLETVGFLMMSHTQPPEVLAKQARIMADAGCQCVYIVDSAGALVLEQVSDRVAAVVRPQRPAPPVRLPGPQNHHQPGPNVRADLVSGVGVVVGLGVGAVGLAPGGRRADGQAGGRRDMGQG